MKKKIHLLHYKLNTQVAVNLDENTDWVANILKELCEDHYDDSLEVPSISFQGFIERKNIGKYGDYLVLSGAIKASFPTVCTQTGESMMDSIDEHFAAVFLNESMKDKYNLHEETTLFFDGKECELYFYQTDIANIEEAINEFIFLAKNPYPTSV